MGIDRCCRDLMSYKRRHKRRHISREEQCYWDKVNAEYEEKKALLELTKFDDDDVIEDLVEIVLEEFETLTTCCEPMAALLLEGPSGRLAEAFVEKAAGVPFYRISGASEENTRELFYKAYQTSPSIVFVDEIDSIEPRLVTQLVTCVDESFNRFAKPDDAKGTTLPTLKRYCQAKSEGSNGRSGFVLVVGATIRPYDVDPELTMRGRFDREIKMELGGGEDEDEDEDEEELSMISDYNGKKSIADDYMLLKGAVSSGQGAHKPTDVPGEMEKLSINTAAFEAVNLEAGCSCGVPHL